ncbi:hypothetical protein D3C85_1512930 [compost metagenome]
MFAKLNKPVPVEVVTNDLRVFSFSAFIVTPGRPCPETSRTIPLTGASCANVGPAQPMMPRHSIRFRILNLVECIIILDSLVLFIGSFV